MSLCKEKIMSQNNIKILKPHISINVRNIEESVGFYHRLFGVEPVKFIKRKPETSLKMRESASSEGENCRFGYAKFDLQNPPLNFVLNEVSQTAAGGTLSHLGIQVESTKDVLKMRERWIAEGLFTNDEMKVDCCYALQDKTWVRDPDGNEWEVFVVLENTETEGGCICGEKVEHQELSISVCRAETTSLTNINHSARNCC